MNERKPLRDVQEKFYYAAEDLPGLSVEIPFRTVLDDVEVRSPVLVKNFGAPRGTVLFVLGPHDKAGDFREVTKVLKKHGYTVSLAGSAGYSAESFYDREIFLAMLREWGWSGDTPEPTWLSS